MRKTTKKRPRLYPGICGRAARLGVSRQHLYYVLSGKRKSESLKARYQALLAEDNGKGGSK